MWVWERQEEQLSDRLVEGKVKHREGSLMMWGCMFWKGPGYVSKIDDKINTVGNKTV